MRILKFGNFVALAAGLMLGDVVLAGFGGMGLAFCFLNAATEADNSPTFQA
jgi:hypothetical protein